MHYYAQYNESGKLFAIGTCSAGVMGVEITKEEYDNLLTMIREKADLVNKLYNEEITINDVPAEWQEEIQRRVDERIAAEGEAALQEISGDEFYSMIEGVL